MGMSVGSSSGSDEPMVEMNTTPLIDVMLVLLVMIIVTIPVQKQAVKLDMPRPSANKPTTPPEVVELEVDFDGTVLWNGNIVPDQDQMIRYLAQSAAASPQPEIHLRPNRLAKYEIVGKGLLDFIPHCEHRPGSLRVLALVVEVDQGIDLLPGNDVKDDGEIHVLADCPQLVVGWIDIGLRGTWRHHVDDRSSQALGRGAPHLGNRPVNVVHRDCRRSDKARAIARAELGDPVVVNAASGLCNFGIVNGDDLGRQAGINDLGRDAGAQLEFDPRVRIVTGANHQVFTLAALIVRNFRDSMLAHALACEEIPAFLALMLDKRSRCPISKARTNDLLPQIDWLAHVRIPGNYPLKSNCAHAPLLLVPCWTASA